MHIPVLPKETKDLIDTIKPKTILDCTFGAGGHSKIFLDSGIHVIAIDRDLNIIPFEHPNLEFHNDSFSNFHKYVEKVDMIFADLGMSTMQLESNRGFSFMTNTPLDMRMDETINKIPLRHIINRMPAYQIVEIIKNYGEERQARKIASNIEKYRLRKNIETSFDLREAIGIDDFSLLARVFQAFRIYINDEMKEIETLLNLGKKITKAFGIITFHSLEDRMVKNFLKSFDNNGFILPSKEEISLNPKSRSAKLRYGF